MPDKNALTRTQEFNWGNHQNLLAWLKYNPETRYSTVGQKGTDPNPQNKSKKHKQVSNKKNASQSRKRSSYSPSVKINLK